MLAASLALTAFCNSTIAFMNCFDILEVSILRPVVVAPCPGMPCGKAPSWFLPAAVPDCPRIVGCSWRPVYGSAAAEIVKLQSAIASATVEVLIVLLSRPKGLVFAHARKCAPGHRPSLAPLPTELHGTA